MSTEGEQRVMAVFKASAELSPALHKTFHDLLDPIKSKYQLDTSQAYMAFGDACLRNAITNICRVGGKPVGDKAWFKKAYAEMRLTLRDLE